MRIAISGLHGTGKSTVARKLSEYLDIPYYSTGMLFRELAREKGLTLEQMSELAEMDDSIDRELDKKIEDLAKKGSCILDNQLSPYLLGDILDVCILLKCATDVRIRRMAERDGDDIERKIEETTVREESERKRFIEYYGIDIRDTNLIMATFDLILDTTYLDPDAVFGVIIKFIEEFRRCRKEGR